MMGKDQNTADNKHSPRVGFVAIGRNEGARLVACLKSLLTPYRGPVFYVDSGSTDGSIEAAEKLGANLVRLDVSIPFTAARARNAGYAALKKKHPSIEFVHFIDGDCTLVDGWLETALSFLEDNPRAAVACGRRRERFPEASLYNRLCDLEWATPVGEALACGGDALFRASAFEQAGLYLDSLVAGEEPELCLRLRERDWSIHRLDAEMTLHDAAITKFSQWRRRTVRAGHAFAEVSALHAASPKRIWRKEALRALLWAGLAPAVIILALSVHSVFLGVLLIYPMQIVRLALREDKLHGRAAWAAATLSVVGKFAETQGILTYWLSRLQRRQTGLIEYKSG